MPKKPSSTPKWCDLGCPHAEWPKEGGLDGSGSCRTFVALHCKLHNRIVSKNAPCLGPADKDGKAQRENS